MAGLPVPRTASRYETLLAALYARELFGVKLGLGNTRALLAALGHPERRFPAVLVAGTNGKGSTVALLAAMFRAGGRRTGLFTSPHLHDYRERLRVDGVAVGEEELARLAEPWLPLFERRGATYFEAATALAFAHFARREVDVGVIEVGLGGRLDATNTLPRPFGVITDVDRDHEARLGRTLALIAGEKAGILRRGVPAVSGCRRPAARAVVRRHARRKGARLVELQRAAKIDQVRLAADGTTFRLRTERRDYGLLRVALAGAHQAHNAALAVLAAERFPPPAGPLPAEAVRAGLAEARWPGRMEVLAERPLVLADVAHNPQGARTVVETLEAIHPGRRTVVVFGCLADKKYDAMLRTLSARAAELILTRPATASRETASLERLARRTRRLGVRAWVEQGVEAALDRARRLSRAEDLILVTGSTYLVAEARVLHGRGMEERI